MAEIQPSSTGLSGEYFVAAELLRRGFSVGISMGNTKSIDILAEKNGKQFSIQVKSIYKKKNVGWPMNKARISDNIWFVFVNLNGDKMNPPDFYIASAAEAQSKLRGYKIMDIIDLSTVNHTDFLNRWGKLN